MAAILDQHGHSMPTAPARLRAEAIGRIRAAWDASRTTSENENHWANADALSAAAAGAPEIRRTLRIRARYEAANNCYARGIVLTLAQDLIGTGPRLQVRSTSPALNRFLEREFRTWSREVRLAKRLRTLRQAKAVDGEAFLELVTNDRLRTRVKLDLRPIEADRIATPDLAPFAPGAVDGIRFDAVGNPLEYHRLRHHPGDLFGDLTYDTIPASRMIHWFRVDRPGQVRGVPEIVAALPLFAQLRRYRLAVLASAETAADFAAVMYTDAPSLEPEDIPNLSQDDGLPIDRRVFQVLPNGWKINQLKAEQPTTGHAEFVQGVLCEIARAVLAPRNVATGDSSAYNYSSGRLDRQGYRRQITVDRDEAEIDVLARIVDAWLEEAQLLDGYLPDEFFVVPELPVDWQWDGEDHVDPTKESTAQATRLKAGTTHRQREYAREGLDVDAEDERAATSWGVSMDEYRRAVFKATFAPNATGDATDGDDEEDEEDRAASPAGRAAA